MGKLIGHCIITGILKCETGLRIGGSKESMEIGGTDNPIIRHPITNVPYIPGSSLKGKIRSLLEQKHRSEVMNSGKPCDCGNCFVCEIFGCSSARNTKTVSRAIFRDINFKQNYFEEIKAEREKGIFYAESKVEVSIDRKKGTVGGSGPRWQERIPAGALFNLEITLRCFEDDNVDENLNRLKEGLQLLQQDTLGGSGTRGYGKVSIQDINIEKKLNHD